MGNFAPVFLAFVLNSYGIRIFLEQRAPCIGPLLSYLIFLFAVFILLWDMRLYPKSLRKLWRCGDCFLQFLIADFIMEHLMADFWLPLETTIILGVPALGDMVEDLMGQNVDNIFEIFKSDLTGVIGSYCLSIFFFIAVLHATRAIDLRLLGCGIKVFVNDITCRLRRGARKIMAQLNRKKKCQVGSYGSHSPTDMSSSQNLYDMNDHYSYDKCDPYEEDDQCDCCNKCDLDNYSDYECEPPLCKTKKRKKRC